MRLETWTKRTYAVCLSAVLLSAACGGDGDKKTDRSGVDEGDGGSSGNTGNNGGVNNNGGADNNGAANNNGGGGGDAGAGNNNGGNPSDGGASNGGGGDAGPVCGMPCDDGVDCTTDTCVSAGRCSYELTPDACAEGQSCHPMTGCTPGKACSAAADCADADGCTTNERCDAALATCKFDPLDGDGDGVAPAICGGGDCNDDDARVGPGQSERCNAVDDDCDGNVDDGAMCDEGAVCKEGSCQCDTNLTECGRSGCVDLQTDPDNCGECGNDCGPAGTCSAGVCACAAPGTMCGDSCVDTMTSPTHCGGCDTDTDDRSCRRNQACIGGTCTDCGASGQACCATGDGCSGNLECSGMPGTAGATCGCKSPNMMCGEACVDVTTSETHCGGCDKPCQDGEQCQTEGAASVCTACGALDQVCCKRANGNSYCNSSRGNDLTCDENTGKCVE